RALARTARTALKPVERVSLLGDEWWMVRSGRHDADTYFDLSAALADDESAEVTSTIAGRLNSASQYLVSADQLPMFQEWIRGRFGRTLSQLGLPGPANDSDERQSRRASLLALVGSTGNDAMVQAQARQLATKYMMD